MDFEQRLKEAENFLNELERRVALLEKQKQIFPCDGCEHPLSSNFITNSRGRFCRECSLIPYFSADTPHPEIFSRADSKPSLN